MSDDKPSPDQEPWRDGMVPAQSYAAAQSSLGPVPGSAWLRNEADKSDEITRIFAVDGEDAARQRRHSHVLRTIAERLERWHTALTYIMHTPSPHPVSGDDPDCCCPRCVAVRALREPNTKAD